MKKYFAVLAIAVMAFASCKKDPATEVAITGDGINAVKTIKKSEAATTAVKIDVEATEGIETFMIAITSSSAAFTGALAAVGLDGAFDLANPDAALTAKLQGLGALGVSLPYGNNVKGKTGLQFDITGFIPMMFAFIEAGNFTADFKLTVTDPKGTKAEKTVKLSLVDDTPAK